MNSFATNDEPGFASASATAIARSTSAAERIASVEREPVVAGAMSDSTTS